MAGRVERSARLDPSKHRGSFFIVLRSDWNLRPLLVAAVSLIAAPFALGSDLRVEIGQTRSLDAVHDLTDAAVRTFARRAALLGHAQLENWASRGRLRTPYTLPLRVVLTRNGVPIPPHRPFLGGSDITLTFSLTRPFPAGYQTTLQGVFTQAKPAMNAVFGPPAVGGPVLVSNYDADIQDRYAVGGGYYVANGGPSGEPEIRFPVYFSTEGAGVNFLHCLLLAYQGQNPYPFDAVNEGLVRAATMKIARTAGSLPATFDPVAVENALESLYDVSGFYDWYNQPALGCEHFIAPNLLNTQLPPGGSTGGIYLVRYLMAGTAWHKVIAEYPGFIAEFNSLYYANPSAFQTMPELVALGQQALDFVGGAPNSTVEAMSFADWVERQYILDAQTTGGLKIMVQPFPIDATGGTSDFGVYGFDVNVFRTAANGDESLLAGTSYPIYWRPDFSRFFMAAQDDQIKLAGAYGAVVPNFPGATFNNKQYRVAIDVPFGDSDTRVVVPAGSFSTGTNPLPNNFIGTLTGLSAPALGTYEVSVEWPGGSQTGVTVDNFAFGANITDPNFLKAQAVTVRVFVNAGSPSEIFSRRVNKGFGMLALNLSPPESDTSYDATVLSQLDFIGIPLQQYRVRPTDAFAIADPDLLFARWNSTLNRYDIFPTAGQILPGFGFYLRPASSGTTTIHGYSPPKTPISIALVPGWNMVTVPFNQSLDSTDVTFTVATEAVSTFAEAVGTIIGNTVFDFTPDGANPDTGTLLPASSFVPGRGYFVRVLRPEGAVMIFTPTDFGTANVSAPVSRTSQLQTLDHAWEAKVQVSNPRFKKTWVVIGQSNRATLGFDPMFDSELPPSPGGFQAALISSRRMFKDIGLWGSVQKFNLDVTGLYKGERETLDVILTKGTKMLTLIDKATGKRTWFTHGGRYFFKAAGTSQSFEIWTDLR